MGGDLRQSTKYIDWAPVPSRWIERRFLVFTALRSPGFFLLHLVLLPIMLLSVMFAGGIFSNAGVPVPMLLVLIFFAWTVIFEFIMFCLASFTVANASGVHVFHFYLCWWRRTDVAWIDFREMACVLDFVAPTVWYGGCGAKGPDTLNLGLRLKIRAEWLQFVRERGEAWVQCYSGVGRAPEGLDGTSERVRSAGGVAIRRQRSCRPWICSSCPFHGRATERSGTHRSRLARPY